MILDASKELRLSRSAYKKAVNLYVWQAYLNDVGKGDVTTQLFIRNKRKIVTAKITAKESGVFAGLMEVEWFLKKLSIQIVNKINEGVRFRKGDVILQLKGRADRILGAERTLLNLLQRMSGVATATNELAAKLPKSIKLLATRKTFWGDLDKRAVVVGGGGTHRLNLNDAVLIKENHLALSPDWRKSFKKVFKHSKKVRFIEVELENLKQIFKFIELYDFLKTPKNLVVMLDNFKPSDIKKALMILPSGVLVEVSGGISGANIKKYAFKGVSAISSGAITNKMTALDLSLNIIK